MSYKTLSIVAAAALAIVGGAAHAVTQNGFANGGFEIVGTTTPAQSWLAAASGYSLSTDARTGTYAALMMSPQYGAGVMLQNSVEQGGMAPLIAGDNPLFSFWAKGTTGTTGVINYALRYLDGTGNILATSMNQNIGAALSETVWKEFTFDLGAVPVGAVAAFVEFSQAMGPIEDVPGFTAGKLLVDDLYLGVAAIPEPGTYALMLAGLAAVGGIARRRRQA